MIRSWIALALLAGSWLLGMDYYQPARWPAWAAVLAAATLLLSGSPLRPPSPREMAAALAMLLPVAWFMPWPLRAAPLLIAAGLALGLAPLALRWTSRLASGAITAGLVLLAQWPALAAYTSGTARSHDLRGPLPTLLAAVASLLGIDAVADGNHLALPSLRQVHRLAATWDLLLDPATLAFLIGGLVLLGAAAWNVLPAGRRWSGWIGAARRLGLVVAFWLPVHAGLLIALFLHRAVRAELDQRLNLMDQFFSPWVYLALLLPPVLLAWRFARLPGADAAPERDRPAEPQRGRLAAAAGLVAAAVALVAFAWQWSPVGRRLEGRVMVVERHSTWEPTDRPYDPDSYGEKASYSYSAIYRYCGQFYEMSRLLENETLDAERLSACDVLVIKTVTARYTREEIDAVQRFVERGGGLLLIGEHTDPRIQTPYANDLASRFGFKFREDLLFRIGDTYHQWYSPPRVPHPMVQNLPRVKFAVSCSIDPGRSRGEAVIRDTGLWSLPPEYHASNFFPDPEMRPEARFGAFIQLWATVQGRGRVAAWTDSTIFSNFSAFEPGKPELLLGMVEWLNHRSPLDPWWARLLAGIPVLAVAIAVAAKGVTRARRHRVDALAILAAALLGWTAGSAAVVLVHRGSMPLPEPVRPLPKVVLDRTVSRAPLSHGGYTDPSGSGFGLLEQWIPRLGYVTSRASGAEAFRGQMLVVLCPTESVPEDYREQLVEFVRAGGRLLVVDSFQSEGTTANSLLWPFGLSIRRATGRPGVLALADGWPAVSVAGACEVAGGNSFLWVDGLPVGAWADYGQGRVMAIGCGTELNDRSFGQTWMREPTSDELRRFDLLFATLSGLAEGRPVVQPPPRGGK